MPTFNTVHVMVDTRRLDRMSAILNDARARRSRVPNLSGSAKPTNSPADSVKTVSTIAATSHAIWRRARGAIGRVWMKAQCGRMHEDPVIFALEDRVSLAIGLFAALAVAVAI
jgi:hypothetical protein